MFADSRISSIPYGTFSTSDLRRIEQTEKGCDFYCGILYKLCVVIAISLAIAIIITYALEKND